MAVLRNANDSPDYFGYDDFADDLSAYEKFQLGIPKKAKVKESRLEALYGSDAPVAKAPYKDPAEVLREIRVRNELAAATREATGSGTTTGPKIAQLNGKDLDFRKYNIAADEDLSIKAATSKQSLADQYKQVAKRMLSVDPVVSNEYMTKAIELEKNAREQEKKNLELHQDKVNLVGTYAGSITNQETLLESVDKIEAMGVRVPDKYKVFTPETQAYWKNKALDSTTYRDRVKLENDEIKFIQDKKIKEAELELQKRKVANDEAKTAVDRENKEISKSSARKAPTFDKDDVGQTRQFLRGVSPEFENLDNSDQNEAARRVGLIADGILKDPNFKGDSHEARQKAQEQVLSYIKDGKLVLPSGGKTATTSGFSTDVQEALTKLKHTPETGYRYWVEGGRLKREKQ